MKRRTFLVITAVIYAIFGLGLIIVPEPFMAIYGLNLNASGVALARVLGAALAAFALLYWWLRDVRPSETLGAMLRASFAYNVIAFCNALYVTWIGVVNQLGWGIVALHLLLAIGFGCYGWAKAKA
jgi:Ca2+/Na+ antiporter